MISNLLNFERKSEPVVPRHHFVLRLAHNVAFSAILVLASLAAGMIGYQVFEGLDTVDSFVAAAMILSGMGPTDQLHTEGGKVFAGCYALYSGLLIITVTGLVLAPLAHRVLHRFHVEVEDDETGRSQAAKKSRPPKGRPAKVAKS